MQLHRQAHIRVVAEVGNGADAINASRDLVPDLMLIDLGLPSWSGIDTTRQLRARQPRVKVLALALYPQIEYVLGMLNAGAKGYALKSDCLDEILRGIATVAKGSKYISPSI